MKIKAFFFLWFFLFFLSCSEIPPKPEISGEQKLSPPVLEMFGYARCSNCPEVEEALDQLKTVYEDSIIVIQYHLRLLGDTLSPEEVNVRANFYNVDNIAPVTFINGIQKITGAPDSAYVTFYNYFWNAKRNPIIFDMKIDTADETLSINITIPDTILIDPSDSLYVIATIDSIYFAQPGAPDSMFNNVAKFIHSQKLERINQIYVPLSIINRKSNLNIFIQSSSVER